MAKVTLRVNKGNTGDPVTPSVGKESMLLTGNKPVIDQHFDLRDILTGLVGKGNTIGPDDKMGMYAGLVSMLGKDKAQKVMNHAYLFNSRPDMQKLGIEDKLQSFYSMGSNDPEVNEVIAKTKSLGYGPVPGFRRSANALNQELSGQIQPVTTTQQNPELQKKVVLRVGK
jgi:hypothetical protein